MDLIELVKATYATIGQEMSDVQLAVTVQDLQAYPEPEVRVALGRCRKELRRVTLADILDRLPGGHPGVEEAWAIVAASLNNEAVTLVWTAQMAEASGVSRTLASDPIAARMAFKETYVRLVSEARSANERPTWTVSLGFDRAGREGAILDAVAKGRLLPAHARTLLPYPDDPSVEERLTTLYPRLLA